MPKHSGPTLPLPALRALRKLGADIRDARRRRRIPVATMCERASISKPSLAKVEKGDPSAQMSLYASVLFVLGMTGRLAEIADVRNDQAGLALEEEHLPERIRLPTKPKKPKD